MVYPPGCPQASLALHYIQAAAPCFSNVHLLCFSLSPQACAELRATSRRRRAARLRPPRRHRRRVFAQRSGALASCAFLLVGRAGVCHAGAHLAMCAATTGASAPRDLPVSHPHRLPDYPPQAGASVALSRERITRNQQGRAVLMHHGAANVGTGEHAGGPESLAWAPLRRVPARLPAWPAAPPCSSTST